MAGISRTGGANVTYFGGVAGTFSGGKPYAVGTHAGIHGSCSFGSTDVSHTASLAGLSAAAVGEIELSFTGPFLIVDSAGSTWAVACEVTSASVVTFYRTPLTGSANAADLPASTHYFNAQRKVLP